MLSEMEEVWDNMDPKFTKEVQTKVFKMEMKPLKFFHAREI